MCLGAEPPRPLSVLVVDDVRDAADSLAAVLKLHGFRATAACGGEDALRAAESGLLDVVLLDLGMPGGVDGFELARRLRARAAGRPLLLAAVTGWTRDEDRQRAAEAGVDLYLVKPADPAVVVEALRRFERAAGRPGGG